MTTRETIERLLIAAATLVMMTLAGKADVTANKSRQDVYEHSRGVRNRLGRIERAVANLSTPCGGN